MGRISGCLWIVGALIGVGGDLPARGRSTRACPGCSASARLVLALRDRQRHRAARLAVRLDQRRSRSAWWSRSRSSALAIYLTGGSLSYIEPLLVCSLLYAAFFFPARWAWPLAIELILVAGTPLLYDPTATENAFPSRYLGLAAGFLAATWVMVGLKRRLVDAEVRQREHRQPRPADRGRQPPRLRRGPAPRAGGPDRARPAAAAPTTARSPCWSSTSTTSRAINDEHGHQVGDTVLREAADRAAGDPALDRHAGADRRRRVRGDRARRPGRGRAADGGSDRHRGQPARSDRAARSPAPRSGGPSSPRTGPTSRP